MRFVFKIVHKCSKCKKEHKIADFRIGCEIFKMCVKCRERGKKYKEKNKCIHSKYKSRCKDCNGASICIHNKRKSQCKECNDPIDITIKRMIYDSKQKDKKHNRYDEPNFIDYPFIQNLLSESNDKCYYCSCELQYTYYTNNLATIERLDNSLGHIKSNCVIACRTCNYTKVGSRVQSL